ncbi:hypothetical protein NHX12_002250 [Muraenolepis orangiensis]|uniref:Dynein regulatory complex subunit 7 MORN domain-containing protein n=1 Tax=Muraenolepis orangiensis TaxID=630683 RepID=A0A9Q0DWJ6_9TELE|nr:hypothetical protein NHX12_002250 [Muraenolepis orangiensis]
MPINVSECPTSYQLNSPQEQQLLVIANNLQLTKFVSTSLRPTMLPYAGLYDWDTCASFVADHLMTQTLDPPIALPSYLFSPTLVLESQRGTCFDSSTLLCSLLLGAGYDAYCVSGYAVRKYAVKPPRELRSNFERSQREKKEQEARAELLRRQQETQRLQEESEWPPVDPLQGQRLHCWVLVLAGRREIQENFFIDSLTGRRFAVSNQSFQGIESLWNQHNYWVNIQDCGGGCVEEESEEPKVFEMPRSWVDKITLSRQDLERRWPGGSRATLYRKAKLEQFAPYLLPDGLVTRLTTYTDLECQEVDMVRGWYQKRQDHLEERQLKRASNVTTELFGPGRTLQLKSHSYVTRTPGGTERDGLLRREESPGEMTETFDRRDDRLFSRQVFYGPCDGSTESEKPGCRPLQKVVEQFHRDGSKAAGEDVAERVFLLVEGCIEVTYHLEDHRITRARRTFVKLKKLADGQNTEKWTPSMVTGYQVDPHETPPKNARAEEEERRRQEEKRADPLAPFLARLGDPETLSPQAARKLEEDCLAFAEGSKQKWMIKEEEEEFVPEEGEEFVPEEGEEFVPEEGEEFLSEEGEEQAKEGEEQAKEGEEQVKEVEEQAKEGEEQVKEVEERAKEGEEWAEEGEEKEGEQDNAFSSQMK